MVRVWLQSVELAGTRAFFLFQVVDVLYYNQLYLSSFKLNVIQISKKWKEMISGLRQFISRRVH